MMDKKDLEVLIDGELSKNGFKKKKSRWYSQSELGIVVFDLQKSQWGNQYYINLCSAPLEIETEGLPTPTETQCPFSARLESAYPELETKLKKILNLEDISIEDKDRSVSIRGLINDYALPFLRKIDGLKNFKRSIEDGSIPEYLITAAIKRALLKLN